ncbi:hypothetical protein XfCFBP8078_01965 [Xylella fastidiosa subsp. multiplex]|nr:hypothetical protein XfCFBP8078_01965 [Xylella fastidiosa subsp. multiplex]
MIAALEEIESRCLGIIGPRTRSVCISMSRSRVMRELTYEEALKVDGQGGAAAAFLEGAGAGSIAGGLPCGAVGCAAGALIGGGISFALYFL